MAPTPRKRPSPVSIRLTTEEVETLKKRSGALPLSTYIKETLFGEATLPPRQTRRVVSADRALLAQVLGQLGAGGMPASLRRLAEAADTGSLVVDDEISAKLHGACDQIQLMHAMLLDALAGRRIKPPTVPTRLDELFNALSAMPGTSS